MSLSSPAQAEIEQFDCNAGSMVTEECHNACLRYNRYADVYDYGDCDTARSDNCKKLREIIIRYRKGLVRSYCDLSVAEKSFFEMVLNQ